MKTLAIVPDAERLVIDYLKPVLISRGKDVTIGSNVPATWNPLPISQGGTKAHILVALDGTPEAEYPIYAAASIRVTAFASGSTEAKTLAGLCEALLLFHSGGGGISGIEHLSGILPAKDNITGAQMASIAVRVNLRYSVIA